MQIDIDFDVFKALTAMRVVENDSYNDVLRRLLTLSDEASSTGDANDGLNKQPANFLTRLTVGAAAPASGTWIGNVFLPDGTKFRATYKGRTYRAEITTGLWIDETGVPRRSPSDAAGQFPVPK